MANKFERYQMTFVLGSGSRGEELNRILADQTKRIQKVRGMKAASAQVVLRIALRMIAKAKDSEIAKEDD